MNELTTIDNYCLLDKTSLSFRREITKEEWMRVFKSLKMVEGCVQFWLGDCLAYRQQKWGMYDDIAEETGYDKDALRHYKRVAENVESGLRNPELGWSHHQEVAALLPAKQEEFLKKAVDEKLSVRKLRAEIRESGMIVPADDKNDDEQKVDVGVDAEKPHVANNSGENDWYTPPEYLEAVRRVLGDIDLDPLSSEIGNRIVHATTYYTKDNALDRPWAGNVFMNPSNYPTTLIKRLIAKFVSHIVDGSIKQGIVLVDNATEELWFRELVNYAAAILFSTGPVKFLDRQGNEGAPKRGQALIYFGDAPKAFIEAFGKFWWGTILPASTKRSRTVKQEKSNSRRKRTKLVKTNSYKKTYRRTGELPLSNCANVIVEEADTPIFPCSGYPEDLLQDTIKGGS